MKFFNLHIFRIFVLVCVLLGLAACASSTKTPSTYQTFEKSNSTIDSINAKLQTAIRPKSREYRLGSGDRIDLNVFQAEQLTREYQINSKGLIQLPVAGKVSIGGLTVDEAQAEIVKALSESVMIDPQVTIAITEYASNEISVTGAVQSPNLYTVKEGRSPFEMLTMAGGLNKDAGQQLHITTRQRNQETGELENLRMIVNLQSFFNPNTPEDFKRKEEIQNLVLLDGDTIYVPKAGLVYIDGAIKKPGSYTLPSDTTIFSLLALAGGAKWSSSTKEVKVVRKIEGATVVNDVNLSKIKSGKAADFKLQAGDLVLVGHNPIKRGLEAFFAYGLRLVIFF